MIDVDKLLEFIKEIKSVIQIDPIDLVNECRDQPSFYEEVGGWSSKIKAEAKSAKDKLDYLKAKYSLDIRNNPDKYDLVKVSEAAITSVVDTLDEIIEAKNVVTEADKYASYLSVLLNAFEQRKSMLRDLVSLYIHKYYGDNVGNVAVNNETLSDIKEDEVGRLRKEKQDEESRG